MLDLQPIKDRLAAVPSFICGVPDYYVPGTYTFHNQSEVDFINNAPQDLAALVAEVERLHAREEYLMKDIQSLVSEQSELDEICWNRAAEIEKLRGAIQSHKDRTTLIGTDCSCSNEDLWKVLES